MFARTSFIVILILYDIVVAEDGKYLSKRQEYDDYRMCSPNFEIHQDKIIRTEESKRLGAKYLNGKDVSTKDECVKFCCETANCNVFVLEEKVFNQQPGTCYLFECGTPDNFKCKFTRHHNYSSAVLIINRPQIQLEDEIQYTLHERELTNLRTIENGTDPKNCHHTTKANPTSDDVIHKPEYALAQPDTNHVTDTKDVMKPEPFKKPSRCSRYQFECHTSGECIAIYNACDGIPQCADHSDESPELGCPTNAPIVPKKLEETDKHGLAENTNGFADKARVQTANIPYAKDKAQEVNIVEQMKNQIPDQTVINRQALSRQYKLNQWQSRMNQQNYNNINQNEIQSYPANVNMDPGMVSLQRQPVENFGREGELEGNPWASKNVETRIFKQSYGPLHNFNHKQNDINVPNYGEYGNPGMNQPYEKYNNGYPNGNYYQPNTNSWHSKLPLSNYEGERTFPDSKNVETPRNRVPPAYPYEEVNALATKNIEPVPLENVSLKTIYNGTAKISNEKKPEPTLESISNTTKSTILNKTVSPVYATTAKAKNDHEAPSSKEVEENFNTEQTAHRKLEKQLTAEMSDVREQLLEVNVMDGFTEQPSGAFISLTLGLCVTAIMVFVVGCRLKVVRKRIRRGGKAPYAHDADFLVNGMYL